MIKKCLGCGNSFESEKNICERCFRLKNYGEYKITTKNNSDYLKIIDNINSNDLVIYVSSLINLNLDYLNKFKNSIVVLTKRDLLPKSIKDYKLIEYISKRYKYLDIEIISSIKNYNLDSLYNKMLKYKKDNIYIIGNTNSGKSTLLNKLIKNYSDSDYNVTTSAYPSTTLDKVEIEMNGLKIIDTPGLITGNSILSYMDLKSIKRITPKKEINPKTYQINGKGALLVDKLIRIDYDTRKNSATFYIANNLEVKKIYNENCKYNVKKQFNLEKDQDLVIEDLGFIKFVERIKLHIYTEDDINIKIRDNLI